MPALAKVSLADCVPQQIGIAFLLLQDLTHTLQDAGVDVPGHISEVGGDIALYQGTVNLPLFVVHLVHDPHSPGNGDLVPCRRRLHNGAQLFRAGAHGILDIFLKHRVKFIIVYNPLSGQAQDQAAVFCTADMVRLQQMTEQHPVILLGDPVKAGQGQHPGSQLPRGHFPAGGQGAHGLMVQKAVGQPLCPGRLHKSFLHIQLHQRNALNQIPGDHIREHGPGFRVILPHDKPHFRRLSPPAGPSHPLKKA